MGFKIGKVLLLQHLTTCNPRIKRTLLEFNVRENFSTNPGSEIDSTFEHFEMKIRQDRMKETLP